MFEDQQHPDSEIDSAHHSQKSPAFDLKQIQKHSYHQQAEAYEYPRRNGLNSHRSFESFSLDCEATITHLAQIPRPLLERTALNREKKAMVRMFHHHCTLPDHHHWPGDCPLAKQDALPHGDNDQPLSICNSEQCERNDHDEHDEQAHLNNQQSIRSNPVLLLWR